MQLWLHWLTCFSNVWNNFYSLVFSKFSILFQLPLQLNMVQKRPFGEELCEVSSKQPRHVEPNSQLVSVLDFSPHEAVAMKPYASGKGLILQEAFLLAVRRLVYL